jgi:hypothetical protein
LLRTPDRRREQWGIADAAMLRGNNSGQDWKVAKLIENNSDFQVAKMKLPVMRDHVKFLLLSSFAVLKPGTFNPTDMDIRLHTVFAY